MTTSRNNLTAMSEERHNVLREYVELARENLGRIDAGSATRLNLLRAKALEVLDKEGVHLPRRGDEGYEKTSVEEMFRHNYGINFLRRPYEARKESWSGCVVPRVTTHVVEVVGDQITRGLAPAAEMWGITIMSLKQAAEKFPDLVAEHYGKLAELGDVPTALNTLLVQDGIFIHVRGNVKKLIQIINLMPEGQDFAAFRRMLVIVEPEASLRLLVCDHTFDNERRFLSSQVSEVFAGRGSNVEIYEMEESSAHTSRQSQMYVRQEADSRIVVNSTTLTCGNTRNDYVINLEEEEADCFVGGMAIATDEMVVDNDTRVNHRVPRCRSNQLFKYVVDDRATGAFEGSILVEPGAVKTEAYQSNKNLLASGDATMHTKPGLVIYNDDVKCSHGASTGQLDNTALFYMQTRGIPKEEARKMLMQAFMSDVIDTVGVDELRDRLRHLVERRFNHDNLCNTCRI